MEGMETGEPHLVDAGVRRAAALADAVIAVSRSLNRQGGCVKPDYAFFSPHDGPMKPHYASLSPHDGPMKPPLRVLVTSRRAAATGLRLFQTPRRVYENGLSVSNRAGLSFGLKE